VDTFDDYFGECSESVIKEHYVVIFEVNSYVNTYIMHLTDIFKVCMELFV